ncbi:hypothetical protein BMS3Abin17_01024 [archaeon BMS3Abin17]|nr:hypothetical protein BMS3Abin17_01024 [archaeon BMS3Abin17]
MVNKKEKKELLSFLSDVKEDIFCNISILKSLEKSKDESGANILFRRIDTSIRTMNTLYKYNPWLNEIKKKPSFGEYSPEYLL